MKKSDLNLYNKGTAEYVISHAIFRRSRNTSPSMRYKNEVNPRLALEKAIKEVLYHNIDTNTGEMLKAQVCETNSEILGLVQIADIVLERAFKKRGTKKDIISAIKIAYNNSQANPLVATLMSDVYDSVVLHKNRYSISLDKMIEWVTKAWEAGIDQYKVYNMEIEGSILNDLGVYLNFGTNLVLFGYRNGYLSKDVQINSSQSETSPKSIKDDFMSKAEQLATLITRKIYQLKNTSLKEVGLGSILQLLKLTDQAKKEEELDIESLNPQIYEIIIYGSLASSNSKPNDIDMLILDNGHFSDFMNNDTDVDDMYNCLSDKLSWLMDGWFQVRQDEIDAILEGTEVDLHVLPIKLIRNKGYMQDVLQKHADHNFFKNAFSEALHFRNGKFETLSIEYLETQYECDLTHLRQ
jgi:hypothetical protein